MLKKRLIACAILGTAVFAISSCGDDDPAPTAPNPTPTAKAQVWHQGIQQVSVNLRGAPVVLASQAINVSTAGKVLVQFDGHCVSSDGDRIVLAASNTTNWGSNDGGTPAEAYDADVDRTSFSHSRAYDVAAGSHTFYAVGENVVETDGTGVGSVYGSLTVKFFPNVTNGPMVAHTGVAAIDQDVRGAPVEVVQQSIDVGVAGEVLVRFDGYCLSTPGDRIVLAASNTVDWGVNDGATGVEALDADRNRRTFSHSRTYAVAPGSYTFYGVAENSLETDGTGIASVYGSLTVEFFPTGSGKPILEHTGVSQTGVDVETAVVTMGQVTFDVTSNGTAVVRYEGLCVSGVDDRIVLAASNTTDWSPNDGAVGVEAVSADLNYNGFSHTRAYAITAGSHTFNGVCQNYVETAGAGTASNYASLSVEFFPD
jgi:hypothetical protein